jgi:hypothetical protein
MVTPMPETSLPASVQRGAILLGVASTPAVSTPAVKPARARTVAPGIAIKPAGQVSANASGPVVIGYRVSNGSDTRPALRAFYGMGESLPEGSTFLTRHDTNGMTCGSWTVVSVASHGAPTLANRVIRTEGDSVHIVRPATPEPAPEPAPVATPEPAPVPTPAAIKRQRASRR